VPAASGSASQQPAPPPRGRYREIPPGYDFPADPVMLQSYRATQDVAEQRRHAWYLWAGLTVRTGAGDPVWDTWYRKDQAFQKTAGDAPSRGGLSTPGQFLQLDGEAGRQALSQSLLSDILFNQPGYDHVRKNKLYLGSELTRINAAFPPGTPWNKRGIPEFPRESAVLKVVYWPVRRDAPTPMPVWDLDPEYPVSPATPAPVNVNGSWKRVVAIDPAETAPHDKHIDIRFMGKVRSHARVVPLGSFHSVRVDQKLVDAASANPYFQASVHEVFGPDRGLEVGDYVVLAALHFTTKEIPVWIWGSVWWHDRPDEGPYAAGRLDAVRGVWRNYLMATTFDFYNPREADGSPMITYNPWLELTDPNGLSSNCMSCHARAMWPCVPSVPVTRGINDPFYNKQVFPPDGQDPAFDGTRTQLDFLWSIAVEVSPDGCGQPK